MQVDTKKKYLLVICMIVVWISVGCNERGTSDELEVILMETESEVEGIESETGVIESEVEEREVEVLESLCSIYICGAVLEAGVYELPEGSRICDAVVAAGGMTESAMETYLNQAELLTDGQMIYVPTREEVENLDGAYNMGLDMGNVSDAYASGLVNINTASREELMTLTGIGEAKAESIIEYREANGFFASIEDIQNITGIKEGVFTQIEDEITV